jgi:hypothetical protein
MRATFTAVKKRYIRKLLRHLTESIAAAEELGGLELAIELLMKAKNEIVKTATEDFERHRIARRARAGQPR